MLYKSKDASLFSTEVFYIMRLHAVLYKASCKMKEGQYGKIKGHLSKKSYWKDLLKSNKIFNGLLSEKQVDLQRRVSFCFIKHLPNAKGKTENLRERYKPDSLLTKKY